MNAEATTSLKALAGPRRDGLRVALEAFARLLEYPGADWDNKVEDARTALHGWVVEAKAHEGEDWREGNRVDLSSTCITFERFCNALCILAADEREELYTATFDVAPACVAYVSIHLFGEENFKRGEFMAALHARYTQVSFDCRGELPDHISLLLRFAAVAEGECRELTRFCLLGPLAKMVDALASENPYRSLLEAVLAVLRATYPGMQPALSPLEQMQRHSGGCPTMTPGCGCGITLDADGTLSSPFPAAATKVQRMIPAPSQTNESPG